MPTATAAIPRVEPEVREHSFDDFRYESRVVRGTATGLAPVVLVGGAFQRKEDWGRLERGLLAHADVVTLDLPGWGTADLLPETYGADFLAAALDRLLDDLDLNQINVMAGSYGTGIAYRLAQTCPDRVSRMVLVGTMTEIPDHAAAAFRHTLDLLADNRMDEFVTATVDLCLTREPTADVVSLAAIRRILLRRVETASADEIAKYVANTRRLLGHRFLDRGAPPHQPALVVTGEFDTFTTPLMCRELAATCVDSWLAIVRRADHLVHLERASELVDLATRFYAGEPIADLEYCRSVERVSVPV